jgi:hypothetical protein
MVMVSLNILYNYLIIIGSKHWVYPPVNCDSDGNHGKAQCFAGKYSINGPLSFSIALFVYQRALTVNYFTAATEAEMSNAWILSVQNGHIETGVRS